MRTMHNLSEVTISQTNRRRLTGACCCIARFAQLYSIRSHLLWLGEFAKRPYQYTSKIIEKAIRWLQQQPGVCARDDLALSFDR